MDAVPRTPRTLRRTKPSVDGFSAVAESHGVEEYELTKNGLRVLYRHDPSAPVVGLMVTYLVGSRHEAVGYTGATHLLEHLMFKGSKKFPKTGGMSVIDRLMEVGALMNATTWLDRTNYYEVLPQEHFEHALALEADRMRNAVITRKDLDEEMPAVRSEYAMCMNSAHEVLDTEMWATAYQAHPYHHSTIGWLSDIENVTIDRLLAFYNTYYWPNNAYVTVVGNITREQALTLVKKYFGVHTRSKDPIPVPYTIEPAQRGLRRFEVSREGEKNIVGIAFKTPRALQDDMPALQILAAVLADGRTSRLHRELVEKNKASDVEAHVTSTYDPGLCTVFASLQQGISHVAVEKRILEVVGDIAQNGITKDELKKARIGVETEMAFSRDGHYRFLSALNESIAAGDWRYYFDLPERFAAVTVSDVRRVAATYCVNDMMTIGHYISTQHHGKA